MAELCWEGGVELVDFLLTKAYSTYLMEFEECNEVRNVRECVTKRTQ
jgi:hypothetical protein